MNLTSQNGWPASKDRSELGIETFLIPGTKIKLHCAKAVSPLLVGFTAEFHELIEPIDEGGQTIGVTISEWYVAQPTN